MPNLPDTLRWLLVLPAAVCGKMLVHFFLGITLQAIGYGGPGASGDSSTAFSLRLILLYVVPAGAFVVAGVMVAPRRLIVTAIVLTVLGIVLSLTTHVVGQHLAGNRVGSTNYVQFAAETAGMLAGIAVIVWRIRKTRLTQR